MKILFVFTIIAAVKAFIWINPDPPSIQGNVEEHFLTVSIAHKASDKRTFELRYFRNRLLGETGKPVIIFLGGQHERNPKDCSEGPIYEFAKQKGAYLYCPELRYFGKSRPFKSLSVDNLKLNTIQNQIEDVVQLIKFIQKDTKAKKFFLIGASYAGALASWLHLQNPRLTSGVWASSPILVANASITEVTHEAGLNFKRVGGDECYQKILQGFETAEIQISVNQTHLIENVFNTCLPLSGDEDADLFFYYLLTGFLSISKESDEFIKERCNVITSTKDPVVALSKAMEPFLKNQKCFFVNYEGFIESLKNQTSQDDSRVLLHHACTQNGLFATAEPPFGVRPLLNFYSNLCQRIFDIKTTDDTLRVNSKKINDKYGAKKGKFKNTFITYGTVDPLRSLGLTESDTSSAKIFKIQEGNHASDVNQGNMEVLNVVNELFDQWTK